MKKKRLLLGLFLMIGTTTNAQNRFHLQFHVAPATGSFNEGRYDDFSSWGSITLQDPAGFAGTGLGLGIEYQHPLNENQLFLTVGLDAYRNPVRRIIRQNFKTDKRIAEGGKSIQFSSYYNFAPAIGLQFEHELKEGIRFYGQCSFLYDVLKISKSEYITDLDASPHSKTYKFRPSGTFGFGGRVGLIMKDTYTMSIAFKKLGSHLVSRTFYRSDPWTDEITTGEDQKDISILNLSIGALF